MHFRGAYHDPAMSLPVTLPPVSAASFGATAAALSPGPHARLAAGGCASGRSRRCRRRVSRLRRSRNMGGWRNWSQNCSTARPCRRRRASPVSPSSDLRRWRSWRRTMSDRYPGYDVLAKRDRLVERPDAPGDREAHGARPGRPRFLHRCRVADRRRNLPRGSRRASRTPPSRAARRHGGRTASGRCGRRITATRAAAAARGLAPGYQAFDAEAREHFGKRFSELERRSRTCCLTPCSAGNGHRRLGRSAAGTLLHQTCSARRGRGLLRPSRLVERDRVRRTGGSARLCADEFDRRDPWEASEARPGRERIAGRENAHVG